MTRRFFSIFVLATLPAAIAQAGDWPQYRADAARTGHVLRNTNLHVSTGPAQAEPAVPQALVDRSDDERRVGQGPQVRELRVVGERVNRRL